MRRTNHAIRDGKLLPIERALLNALEARGEAHGHALSKDAPGTRSAVYRALRRLEGAGLIVSTWEDATLANAESRPLRRVYRLAEQREAA